MYLNIPTSFVRLCSSHVICHTVFPVIAVFLAENGSGGEDGEEESLPEVVVDNATMEKCSTNVQRVFRGHMARKKYFAIVSGLVHQVRAPVRLVSSSSCN